MRRKYKKEGFLITAAFLVLAVLLLIILFHIQKTVMPIAVKMSHIHARQLSNEAIDSAVIKAITDLKITSSDFLNEDNDNNTISADIVLINSVCSLMSQEINNSMKEILDERIKIPLGSLTGFEAISNLGPYIYFSLRPMGTVKIDYETQFASQGINQTNFKIWINLQIDMQLVNPLKSDVVSVERKMMLVDTIIKGDIPNRYIDFGNTGY